MAQSLMRAVETEAIRRGACTLWLGVWERNERAKAFYAKTGFVDVGSHVFMVGRDAQVDRVMVRSLEGARPRGASPIRAESRHHEAHILPPTGEIMSAGYDSELARKLNIRTGMLVRVIGLPAGLDLPGLAMTAEAEAEAGVDALVAFVVKLADADVVAAEVVRAASRGAVTWMAYPKARQLGTDLNRDILFRHMSPLGLDGVRQVAIDEIWSAMRFKRVPLAGGAPTA